MSNLGKLVFVLTVGQISGERLQDHWSSGSYFCSKHRSRVHDRTERFLREPTIIVLEQKQDKINTPVNPNITI